MSIATGHTALVTGASSGIGRAIACALAARGMRIAVTGRDRARLEEVAAQTSRTGAPALVQACDLGIDADIDALAERVANDFGRLDVLVHSAGVIHLGTIEELALQAFDEMYRVNVRAPVLLTRLLLPLLRQSAGQVVFINSTAALAPSGGNGLYAASKQALRSIADGVRESAGVRVLSFFAGRTATPMQEHVHRMERRDYDPSALLRPEQIASQVLGALELPRDVELGEIVMRPANWPPARGKR